MKVFILTIACFLIIVGILVSSAYDEPKKPASMRSNETYPGLTSQWGVSESSGDVVLSADLSAKNYYIVFDGSGSMEETSCGKGSTKLEVAKKALKNFGASVPKDANLGLYVFDVMGEGEKLPLGTQNREQFFHEVQKVSPGGMTPLKTAIVSAARTLQNQAIKQRGYGEYTVVVVTDGEASDGEDPYEPLEHLFNHTPVVVNTIGFCIGENHSLNQPGATVYKSANNQEELEQGLDQVLAEAESFDLLEFDQQ